MEMIDPRQVAILAAFGVSIIGSLVMTPHIIKAAAARELFENPIGGERGPRRPIARLGGIAVFSNTVFGVCVAAALGAFSETAETARVLPSLLLGGTLIFLLGLYDDLRGVRARHKLMVQGVAALAVYILGTRIGVVTIGSAIGVDVGWLSLPLTLFWIVGVTNAVNLIDGMDGLATGIGLVVLSAVSLAAMVLGNELVVVVAIVMVGAMLGFLRYNVAPARIFLGDSGSLFIGFMLSVLAIHGSLKSTTAVLVAIPIFALALPLLDTGLAILRRVLRGNPIFGPDSRHIHHRLQAVGLSPRQAALVMWCLSGAFAVYGLSVAFAPPPILLLLATLGGASAALLVWIGVRRLEYVEIAEAAMALVRRGGGFRKEIRDQIHARELAERIPRAQTLEELNLLLAERRFRFGFARIEVNHLHALSGRPSGDDLPRLLKVDYPLSGPETTTKTSLWLRTWSPLDVHRASDSPMRVSRILAPVIEAWWESITFSVDSATPRQERRRSNEVELSIEGKTSPEMPWTTA